VVDVQQRTLRTFEQHALTLLAQVVQDAGHVGLHRLHVQPAVEGLLEVDRIGVQILGQHEVVVIQRGAQQFFQLLRDAGRRCDAARATLSS
jgi:hypothetical protein